MEAKTLGFLEDIHDFCGTDYLNLFLYYIIYFILIEQILHGRCAVWDQIPSGDKIPPLIKHSLVFVLETAECFLSFMIITTPQHHNLQLSLAKN